MLVLGVDPGTHLLGWGLVKSLGNRSEHVGHGVLKLPSQQPLEQRLLRLDCELSEVIARFQPDVAAVETLFFHKDAQAAAKLGHARGVVLLALARAQVPVAEYAPARVKSTIVGQGQATKEQVARMVGAILRLAELSAGDAADALALALTHQRRAPLLGALGAEGRPIGNPQLAEVLRLAARPRARRKKFVSSVR